MDMDKTPHRLAATLVALAALTLITAVARTAEEFNAIAVVLLYLLVVLATAAVTDFTCGMVTALASGLLVDYCFLPPVGTFHIEAAADLVAFATYAVTALVVSHFAAGVRREVEAARRRQDQTARLARFTQSLARLRQEDLILENLVAELRRAYDLDWVAVFPHGGGGAASPVFAGNWPALPAANREGAPTSPKTLLEAVTVDGPGVCCLDLKDRGETIGALLLGRVRLSAEIAGALAAVASLVARQQLRPAGRPDRA